jgi:hypothetical protein
MDIEMEPLEQLMTARHKAYLTAKAGDFRNEADTKAWREANRLYVLGRAARSANLVQEAA